MYVGVFLNTPVAVSPAGSLPHVCGGVSDKKVEESAHTGSSPCMWGCFSGRAAGQNCKCVFPMYVGVFLSMLLTCAMKQSLPHVCGGVSNSVRSSRCKTGYSPCIWVDFALRAIASRQLYSQYMYVGEDCFVAFAPEDMLSPLILGGL